MSITYPPEMLPHAEGPADVFVENSDGSRRLVYSTCQAASEQRADASEEAATMSVQSSGPETPRHEPTKEDLCDMIEDRDQALIAANRRIMQLERALVRLIDAHDAPEPVRAKAIQDALFVGRGLTF